MARSSRVFPTLIAQFLDACSVCFTPRQHSVTWDHAGRPSALDSGHRNTDVDLAKQIQESIQLAKQID